MGGIEESVLLGLAIRIGAIGCVNCHDMEHYRLFIAAELPAHVKAALLATQQQLRQADPPVTWVRPHALHLTLRFLGETAVDQLPAITAAIGTLAHHTPIALELRAAGAFPHLRRPSVLWAGVDGDLVALAELQAQIEHACVRLGFAAEPQPFHPHLTLGRVRRESSPEQQHALGELLAALPPIAPAPWSIDRIIIFRSELARGGPLYTELADCQLHT